MNDLERHGEIMGALGRIDSRMDSTDKILNGHDDDIKDVKSDVSVLQHRWSRARGVVIALTAIAALGTAIAKAKALF
jgi:hypothetical protein